MSTKVPGSWPTLRGCLNDESQSGAGSGAGSLLTKNDVPRNHEEGVGAGVSFRSGTKMPGVWPTVESCGSGKAVGSSMGIVSSTLRKKVLEGMFENPKPAGFGGDDEELHVGNGVDVSGKRVIPAPECITDRRVVETVHGSIDNDDSSCQEKHEVAGDAGMTLPAFPTLITTTGDTDWAKYLTWMEDDLSLDERVNNNMLLQGNSIRNVSFNEALTHLSLDTKPTAARRLLLFKDLPAMQQGAHHGQAMFILGYDLASTEFFLRLFERLPSTMYLIPECWEFGAEILRLSVGEVLEILRGGDSTELSTLKPSFWSEWNEDIGFKTVVVILFAQWILDFSIVLPLDAGVAGRVEESLLMWRESMLVEFEAGEGSVFDVVEEEHDEQSDAGMGSEIGQEVARSRTWLDSPPSEVNLEISTISSFCAQDEPSQAPPFIDTASHCRRATYDSDEEEGWAALEDWAARNKLEAPTMAVTTNTSVAGAAAELIPDENVPSSASSKADVPESHLEALDQESSVDAKRFSGSSTLCDGCEEDKEKLAFTNMMHKAMLGEGSVSAMLEVYLDYVTKSPEHDSDKKRKELFDFLLAHVEVRQGDSLSVRETLQRLKEMGLTEDGSAETAGVEMKATSDSGI